MIFFYFTLIKKLNGETHYMMVGLL